MASTDVSRAQEIHEKAIVIDMGSATNPADPTPERDGKCALERFLEGGVTTVVCTVAGTNDNFRTAVAEINKVRRFVNYRSDQAMLIQTLADVRRAKAENKLGVVIWFQTGSAFEDDWLNTVPALAIMGLRQTALTYNETNLIGSGCYEPTDNGLTAYGRQVVKALNANGIIIDGSHVGQRTVREAAEYSDYPIVYSHTNAATLFPHARNASDDNLKAVAETGGVVGTTAWEVLLTREDGHKPTLKDLLDNIDYCVNLIGIDHVAIGTDLNENFKAVPMQSAWEATYMGPNYKSFSLPEFAWFDQFPNITGGLVERGYSSDDVTKILGANYLRVAEQVWSD